MAKATKHRTPSKIKYEANNPVVSCRVSRELYEMMVKAKEVEGKSFTDLLKIGLRKQAIQASRILKARKEAWEAGYKKGYADAELLFKVTYPCSVCGKPLSITSKEEKEAAAEHMTGERWGHAECQSANERGFKQRQSP